MAEKGRDERGVVAAPEAEVTGIADVGISKA
jgi:hypothetical protein